MALTVNGEQIPDSEIEAEVDRLRDRYNRYVKDHNEEADDSRLRDWCRENLIERALLRQESARTAAPIPVKELEEAYKRTRSRFGDLKKKEALAQLEAEMKVQSLVKSIGGSVSSPTEDEVREQYEQHKEDFVVEEQVRVRHIVKHTDRGQEVAQAHVDILNIQQKLQQGTAFEQLAALNSDCPDQAGDLGYFGRGQMVPKFEEVVFAMQPGEVSDVFLTEFGYHIARLEDRIEAGPLPLERVRDRIAGHLLETRQQKAVEDFVDGLKAQAEISQ